MPRPRRCRPRAGRYQLRRRRAGLRRRPSTSSRPPSPRVHDPKNHRYTPAAGLPELREAIAAKTLRDSGARGRPVAGHRHQRRQAGRLPGVRDAARPGRRGARARAVLDDLPRGDQAGRRRAGRGVRRRRPGLPGHGRAARGRAHAAHKVLLFVSPSNPTGAVYSPEQTTAIGEWADEHGLWVITDEIYQNLTYDGAARRVDRRGRPGARRPHHPGQRRREDLRDDRLARRMDGRARRTRSRRPATCSRTCARTCRTSRSARPSPRSPARRTRSRTMRQAFDRRRKLDRRGARPIDGIVCPTPAGAFYVYPDVTGPARSRVGGRHADDVAGARRPHPREGGGRGRARRGVRPERVPALQLRARRRGHRRGRRAAAEALRRSRG